MTPRQQLAEAAKRAGEMREGRVVPPSSSDPCNDCSGPPFTDEEKENAKIRRLAEKIQSGDGPTISVVISACNEQENLLVTVASVKLDCPAAEIIVVDDASTAPEPIPGIRNVRRFGGPRSRHLGSLFALSNHLRSAFRDGGGEGVVFFIDAHCAYDWESACWFMARYWPGEALRLDFRAFLDRPMKFATLAAAALIRHAITYGACLASTVRAGNCLVHEDGLLGGRYMHRQPDLPKVTLWETSWLLGAFYCIPGEVLEDFGGWPALPGWHGAQELAVALLAAAHGVKILLHQDIGAWHLFRGKGKGQPKPPFTMPMSETHDLNYPAAYRLALDDAHWQTVRPLLLAGGPNRSAKPEAALRRIETDEEFNRYRTSVQSRFKLDSDELLIELEKRMRADRDARNRGAEDDALDKGKRTLLLIGFAAAPGTTSSDLSLEQKRGILQRCLESARASGADEILISAVGDVAAVRGWPEVAGIRVLNAGANSGTGRSALSLGETRIVRAAIARASATGFEWIVKVGGDTFHPRPNWAADMVLRGIQAKDGAALVSIACDAQCACSKVFAGRTGFLAQTWPTEHEVQRFGAGAVLERIWTAWIRQKGLEDLWLQLPAHRVIEGGASWWVPDDPALAYFHTHQANGAADWKMGA